MRTNSSSSRFTLLRMLVTSIPCAPSAANRSLTPWRARCRTGPWILGDRFSAADVYLGSQIMWGLQFKTLPDRDAFKAYAERLSRREAAGRARDIDDALIAETQAGG